MSTLLFIAADPRECVEWVRHWPQSADAKLPVHWSRYGIWNGRAVTAIANGAGWQRAYDAVRAAAAVSSLEAVCSIGFCGALDTALRVGDVVHVTEVRTPNGPVSQTAGGKQLLVCESVDHIVTTADEKRTLRNAGASVVEMEAAGVARAALELGIPFHCVRAVSDLADESFVNDFGAALLPDGRFSVARLIWGAMGNPVARFAELIRLGRRTALASRNLGEALANDSF